MPRPLPNFVLLFSDDHGVADAGCYGGADVATPGIDALAEQGMRFDAAFAPTAMCCPARATLFTGLEPHRHGCHMNKPRLRPGVRAMPPRLGELGYRVVIAGKTHIQPFEQYGLEFIDIDQVEDFLSADHDQPFFLAVCPVEPHTIRRGDGWAYPEPREHDPGAVTLPPYLVDTPELRRQRAGYYDLIAQLDRQVERWTRAVDRRDDADNCITIYSGDHGAAFPFEKWTCYDAGLRRPLIVRDPGRVAAGATSGALVGLHDFMPTFIDLAGGSPPTDADGRSFRDVLEGHSDHHHDAVCGAHTNASIINGCVYPIRTIRTRRYRYIENLFPEGTYTNIITQDTPDGQWTSWLRAAEHDASAADRVARYRRRPAAELYDHAHDPCEMNNLAAAEELQPVVRDLRRRLHAWMADQGDPGLTGEVAWEQAFHAT